MNLILCSGNSLRNRDWIVDAEARIKDKFDTTYIQQYQHWSTGNEWIDLDYEAPILGEAAGGLGMYGVFAKSIGTVLTVQAMGQGYIRPKFLLLCGIPLNFIIEHYPEFKDVLAGTGLPLTIIHNSHDKVGTSQAVQEYFGEAFADLENYRYIETPGNTHDYENYVLINTELDRLRGLAQAE